MEQKSARKSRKPMKEGYDLDQAEAARLLSCRSTRSPKLRLSLLQERGEVQKEPSSFSGP